MEDRVEILILCDVVILKLDVNKLEKSLLGWHFKLVLCHLVVLRSDSTTGRNSVY